MHFSSSPPAVRRALVRWLQAAALMHLLVGLGLTWAGHSPLLGIYQLSIEQAFWGQAAPAPAREQQVWWLALFGSGRHAQYQAARAVIARMGGRLSHGSTLLRELRKPSAVLPQVSSEWLGREVQYRDGELLLVEGPRR
jgi:hypothetical protein